uniref:Arginine biosynthesis bifunctional protein ArgJ n=1 Tax=Dictyoglomus turgidum TaxID=513050 RepID=A0A7C3SRJ4_9BACT
MVWKFDEIYMTNINGVRSAGVSCGLKEDNKLDLALIVLDKPVFAEAMFTKNTVKAAPIIVSKRHLEKYGMIQAIVINSGQANACTGEKGIKDAEMMAERVAKNLGIDKELVFVASTGKIGAYLEMDKIVSGIDMACKVLSKNSGRKVAEAIMTTDTFPKISSVKYGDVVISGIAKGAGMIHPDMATMLVFIGTNAKLEKDAMKKILRRSVDRSFHQISIDGCTSTNDTVLLFATGEKEIKENIFQKGLNLLTEDLAKMIAKDGEGATKLIEIRIEKAESLKKARVLGRAVITSNLVKAAFAGGDDNWGRILASIGQTGYIIDLNRIELYIGKYLVFAKNEPLRYNSQEVKNYLKNREVMVRIVLNEGRYNATSWGSDLTEEYVKINAYYRT